MRQPFDLLRQSAVRRTAAVVVALALGASACGGGGGDPAPVEVGAAPDAVEAPTTAPAPVAPAETEPASEPAVESTEPTLIAATADGGQLDFGTLQGRDVVLWFWAPW